MRRNVVYLHRIVAGSNPSTEVFIQSPPPCGRAGGRAEVGSKKCTAPFMPLDFGGVIAPFMLLDSEA